VCEGCNWGCLLYILILGLIYIKEYLYIILKCLDFNWLTWLTLHRKILLCTLEYCAHVTTPKCELLHANVSTCIFHTYNSWDYICITNLVFKMSWFVNETVFKATEIVKAVGKDMPLCKTKIVCLMQIIIMSNNLFSFRVFYSI
jgi:hypothetical protein